MTAYPKTATIKRAKTDDKYFRMHRDTAQDSNLSWEARGVIAYILSKPDDWIIQVHDLMQNCQKGRVYRILDELKAAGYLEDRTKYRDDKGKWQWTPYILHERPVTNVIAMPKTESKEAENPYPEKQDADNPYPDFRDTEKRDTENAEIKEHITEDKEQTTEKHNTPVACSIIETKINPSPVSQMNGLVLDTSRLPKVQLTDKDLNKRVRAIITTYLKVSGVIKSNAHAVWNADARQLVLHGIDNKQVAKFVAEKQKEPFFKDKPVTWGVVTGQIVSWVRAYEAQQARAAQPDLHAQWGVTPDDYMLPDLYDSPFDLKYPDEKRAG